jgi:PAS domain S-box-containing protein
MKDEKKIQSELISEDYRRSILDSMPDAIHVIDRDMRLVLLNRAFQQWNRRLGFADRAVGKELFKVFPFLSDTVREEYRQVLESGRTLATIEETIIDGQTYTTETRKIPVLQNGTVVRIVTVLHDITERRKMEQALRESERRYRDLFENANDIIYTHDLEGNFTSINRAAQRITGYGSKEALRMNISQILVPKCIQTAKRMIASKLKGSGPTTYELEILSKNGQCIPIEVSTRLMLRDGEPVGIQGIARDITERKRAEIRLKESEEKFKELANSLPQIIFETDPEGNLTFANRDAFQLFGYTQKDMKKGINVLQTVVPEDRDRARANMAQIMKGKKGQEGNEYRALRKDGTVFPVVIHSVPIIEDGKPAGLRGIIVDIGDRVQAEDRFRLTAQVTADLIYEWDVKSDTLEWFGDFDDALGYEPGEIPRTVEAWARLIHPQDLSRMKDSVEHHRTSTEPIHDEYRVRRKDGRWRYWMDRGAPVLDENNRPVRWIGGCTDITERKRSEAIQAVLHRISNAVHTTQDLNDLFNEIRRELSTVLNTENFFIALYDKDSDTFSLPYFKDEKDVFKTYPAKKTLTAYVVKHDQALLVTDDDIRKFEETGEVDRVGSPSKIWLGVPLKVDREIIGALVVQSYTDEKAYDQTDLEVLTFVSNQIGISIERKRAQEALKASEERYRTLIENQQEGIAVVDQEERFLFANPAAHEIFGVPAGSLPGASMKQYVDEENASILSKQTQLRLSGKKSKYELTIIRPDGGRRILLVTAMPRLDRDRKIVGTFGVFHDVTERRRAEQALRESEEQLRQSQKMEAVGRLAGGIAHDLNNLLTGVTGYGDLLAARISGDSPLKKYVTEVQNAAQRAAALIGQLLAFSRKQILQPKVMLLNDTVKGMKEMLQRVMGEDVELMTHLATDLGTITADPGQIEQVIMNLAVNARDAMPGGGTLTIETANVTLDEKYTGKHPHSEPGPHVMLSVSDTGEGMDKETQRRIFEPFFTTKEVGKGTGLGLSTIYGIVKQSGGTIWLYSEVGHGTTFKIYLPRNGEDSSARQDESSEDFMDHGTGPVLVTEDEDVVRELTAKNTTNS